MSSANVYIYDIEVYPNLFMIAIWSKNKDKFKVFTVFKAEEDPTKDINDIEEIIEFFSRSNIWMVGYNNSHYDDSIINYILKNKRKLVNLSPFEITLNIQKISNDIIVRRINKYKYDNYFGSIDVMRVGNIQKSLKLVAVNLKWHKIQDLPYLNHAIEYDQLEEIRKYNINDVNITRILYNKLRNEVNLRASLTYKYNVDGLMIASDSGMANILLESIYENHTGISKYEFKNLRTERLQINIKDCISDKVKFRSKIMKGFLEHLKKQVINIGSDISYRISIGNMIYNIAKGGLHSENQAEIIENSTDTKIIDVDVSSYYPMIMINYNIKPEHLPNDILSILNNIVVKRLEAKATRSRLYKLKKERELTKEEKIELSKSNSEAEGLKIVVNSIYGKLGYEYHWLYDLLAMYQVTFNGQLFLLMLIEILEENNFEVVYANTDGIAARVPVKRKDDFIKLCEIWSSYTNFELEYDYFKKMIIKDVNNYIVVKEDDSIKSKGELNYKLYENLKAGFNKPIVALAIHKYFVDNIPVENTIREHEDILDFCMAQKPGDQFEVEYHYINDNRKLIKQKVSRTNRYIVTKSGGILVKVSENTKGKKREIRLVADETINLVNDYSKDQEFDIKYSYYIKEAKKVISLFNNYQKSLF